MKAAGWDRSKYNRAVRMNGPPHPSRITAALDIQDLHGPEVDLACGVEEPTVDLWETGEIVPTREQVERLAFVTGFPVSFFYQEPPQIKGSVVLCGEDGCEFLENPSDPPVEPTADILYLAGPSQLF